MTDIIELKLFATLADRLPGNAAAFPLESGETAGALIRRLGISEADARLIFINGRRKDPATVLRHGDVVGIFPPVGGG